MPTLTKDGKVRFGRASDLGVSRNRIGATDPKQRPYWYNATASGDTIACTAGSKPSCP